MNTLRAEIEFVRGDFHLAAAMAVEPGRITALVGPSGCGKSTFLRLLAGLERPSRGRISLGDTPWFDAERGLVLPTRRRRVGFMFQSYALFPHLSVGQNVAYGLAPGEPRDAVDLWLERLHIADLAERRPAHLSGGQRQRVALARALAFRPDVLLLDEPFSAVDFGLRQNLRTLFREAVASADIPVLLVTHDLDDVRQTADSLGVMIRGRLRGHGPVETLFSRPDEVDVARILGWTSILPVAGCDGTRVWGAWGELALPEPAVRAPDFLGIAANGPQLASQGLEARLLDLRNMGAFRLAFFGLADGSRLQVNLPLVGTAPEVGGICRIAVPPASVAPLRSARVVDTEAVPKDPRSRNWAETFLPLRKLARPKAG